MSRNDRRGWIAFGVLLAGIGVYLFVLGDSTTFFRDEWSLIAYRDGRSAANILGSHQDQLIANFLLFYVGFFKGIGLDQYWLIRLLTLPLLLGCPVVIYFIGSRRMGAWAIAPALIILLLGTAWETLLWPLGIFAFGAVCFLATAALLAMERDDWKWDLTAFLLLMTALGMNGLTLAFLVGGALGLLMLPRPGWKRLWIVVIPGAVYLLWSHFYRTVPVDFGSTIGGVPHFAWDLAVNGVSGFTGLSGRSPK
ncbi:MAG: hypothetical protein IPK93_05940 [Solirubrobacterales bacterium]|nr:hypothetical protein [Solirubrobacterales bacterium]